MINLEHNLTIDLTKVSWEGLIMEGTFPTFRRIFIVEIMCIRARSHNFDKEAKS
jgi:hypothetical protein